MGSYANNLLRVSITYSLVCVPTDLSASQMASLSLHMQAQFHLG